MHPEFFLVGAHLSIGVRWLLLGYVGCGQWRFRPVLPSAQRRNEVDYV